MDGIGRAVPVEVVDAGRGQRIPTLEEALKPDVDFWIRVYTEVTTNEGFNGTAHTGYTTVGGDLVFKFKGVSIFADYFHRVSEPERGRGEPRRAESANG